MGGPSGIPFSQIVAFMDEYEVVGRDDRDKCITLIQRVDARFRKKVDEQIGKTMEKKSG